MNIQPGTGIPCFGGRVARKICSRPGEPRTNVLRGHRGRGSCAVSRDTSLDNKTCAERATDRLQSYTLCGIYGARSPSNGLGVNWPAPTEVHGHAEERFVGVPKVLSRLVVVILELVISSARLHARCAYEALLHELLPPGLPAHES